MTATLEARREEHAKYVRAYTREGYRMSGLRETDAVRNLAALPVRGAYLDVGCGRGEMLAHARRLGYAPVLGVEIVPALIDGERVLEGVAHALPVPDASYDVVTLFDVIEHLLPGDDEAACRELARVARRHILITANNHPSNLPDGTPLHINVRPYAEWARLFTMWFSPAVVRVAPIAVAYANSPMWRVDRR